MKVENKAEAMKVLKEIIDAPTPLARQDIINRSSDRQVDMNGDVYIREDEDYLDRD
tara:strand:+ start:192 stop:359 length:168 start_codon:yes stop_codon:yes gene_type:complete